jgi:hypothetical protein
MLQILRHRGKANEMVVTGVLVDDAQHLSLRKLLQEVAASVAPYCHPTLSAVAYVTPTPSDDAARERDRSAVDEFMARIQRPADASKRVAPQGEMIMVTPVLPRPSAPAVKPKPEIEVIPRSLRTAHFSDLPLVFFGR